MKLAEDQLKTLAEQQMSSLHQPRGRPHEEKPLPVINYGGRFVYVETIEKEWPELLDTLCARCLPAFRKAVLASQRPIPSSFSSLRSCAEYETCLRQVRAWADRHSIRDEWILDAAVQPWNIWKLISGGDGAIYRRTFLCRPSRRSSRRHGFQGSWIGRHLRRI
jgi:hypothetical protein